MKHLRSARIGKALIYALNMAFLCLLVSCNAVPSEPSSTFPDSSSAIAFESSGIDAKDDTALADDHSADTVIQISDRTYFDFNLSVNPDQTGSIGSDYEIRKEQEYPRPDWIEKARVALYQTEDYRKTCAVGAQDTGRYSEDAYQTC